MVPQNRCVRKGICKSSDFGGITPIPIWQHALLLVNVFRMKFASGCCKLGCMQRRTTSIQRIRVYLSRWILQNHVPFILGVCIYIYSVYFVHTNLVSICMRPPNICVYIYIHIAKVHMTRPKHGFSRVNSSHRHSNDSCFARNQRVLWTLRKKNKGKQLSRHECWCNMPCSEPCVSKKVACDSDLSWNSRVS